jgi:hypothetical protein
MGGFRGTPNALVGAPYGGARWCQEAGEAAGKPELASRTGGAPGSRGPGERTQPHTHANARRTAGAGGVNRRAVPRQLHCVAHGGGRQSRQANGFHLAVARSVYCRLCPEEASSGDAPMTAQAALT